MFDPSDGLRFDIYERIQLSEEVAGIAELEEIELLPHIQVISQAEQAALRGHLLLTGLYRGDAEGEEKSTQRLEHYIPVEITVPLNRVTSLDEIAIEIENFDVDVLSLRSLNVTGVLSLRGIQAQTSENSPWNTKEFTVVHEVQPDEPVPYSDKESQLREGTPHVPQSWHFEHEDEEELLYPDKLAVDAVDEEEEGNQAANLSLSTVQEERPAAQAASFSVNDNSLQEEEAAQAAEAQAAEIQAAEIQAAERTELRIALNSKKSEDRLEQQPPGFTSILNSSRSQREQELPSVQEIPETYEELGTVLAEDTQWKSVFLSNLSEQSPFRKVRLCIVQREETLELIADRYQLTPRELLLYNRLSDHTLEEGQVLYIP